MKNMKKYYNISENVLSPEDLKEYKQVLRNATAELAIINADREAKGLIPMRSIVTKCKIKYIKLDPDYQRVLKAEEVTNIVSEFDPDKVGVIVGSARKDGIYVADGQHRVTACYESGEDEVYVQLYIGLSKCEEAALFSDQDLNRTTLTRVIKLRADYKAGRKYAVEIVDTCEEYGYVLRFPGVATGTAHNINAVTVLIDVHHDYHLEGLKNALDLFEAAGWDKYDETCKHVYMSMSKTINSILKKTGQKKGGKAWCKIVAEMSKGRPGYFLGEAHKATDEEDRKENMHSNEKALKEYMIMLSKD